MSFDAQNGSVLEFGEVEKQDFGVAGTSDNHFVLHIVGIYLLFVASQLQVENYASVFQVHHIHNQIVSLSVKEIQVVLSDCVRAFNFRFAFGCWVAVEKVKRPDF